MTLILTVVLIVVIVVSLNKRNDLKNENEQLRRELERWKKTVRELKEANGVAEVAQKQEAANEPRVSVEKVEKSYANEVVQKAHYSEAEKHEIENKNEYENRRKKNTSILISGAILIVLAAIVFLTSTWNTIPDLLKTIVLGALIPVFFGISYIADKKFELIQTSKTFYYIAMAYIPIVLFAISLFKLFGEYLSYIGEGNYIYQAACAIFLSILYLIESRRKDNSFFIDFYYIYKFFTFFNKKKFFIFINLLVCLVI